MCGVGQGAMSPADREAVLVGALHVSCVCCGVYDVDAMWAGCDVT